jgi:RNA polymerase II subunit A small phosphatase-like protein
MDQKPQRRRGQSFKQDYSMGAQPSLFEKMKARVTGQRLRQPSMVRDIGRDLIPPRDPALEGRLTVVLDLDETLIYAREGPLYARPGVDELLLYLKEHFEAIVWTAGVKAYAQAVVKNIDKLNAIQHCVYRHKKWFTGCAGYNKDLTLLGRDMKNTIIIENTPDCLRGNEGNGILVADYEGGELADDTLYCILALLKDLVEKRKTTQMSAVEYIATSKFLTPQAVPTDLGDPLNCYCLDASNPELFKALKEQRQNMDLSAAQRRK